MRTNTLNGNKKSLRGEGVQGESNESAILPVVKKIQYWGRRQKVGEELEVLSRDQKERFIMEWRRKVNELRQV